MRLVTQNCDSPATHAMTQQLRVIRPRDSSLIHDQKSKGVQVQNLDSNATHAMTQQLVARIRLDDGGRGYLSPPKGEIPRPRLRAREGMQANQILGILGHSLDLGMDVGELPQLVELAQIENHNANQIFGELLLVFSKLPDGERVPAMRLAKEVFG